jgi:hypothetical protein
MESEIDWFEEGEPSRYPCDLGGILD